MTVSVTPKTITLTNGTANDATVVNQMFTDTYGNEGTLAAYINANCALTTGPNTFSQTQTFTAKPVMTAGENIAVSADPGSLVDGDIWYNSTDDVFKGRINGATKAFGLSNIFQLGYVTGRYYITQFAVSIGSGGTGTGIGPVSGTPTIAHPIYIGSVTTFDRIGVVVSFAGGGGSTVRLSIYNTGANGLPSTLLLNAGTIDSSTTGLKLITISQTLQAGWYWLAANPNGTTVGLRNLSTSFFGWSSLGITVAGTDTNQTGLYDTASTPSTFTNSPTYLTDGNVPLIYLRAN